MVDPAVRREEHDRSLRGSGGVTFERREQLGDVTT